ncbi:hypothetical protein TX23_22245 [Pseudomonas paralactis]|uniref:Uncharacterized protein n=1 Tax=Pseudomonas paralactis TaxID=1615673 RepID=A0A0R3A9C5_9PSED|nr:hypothetical protein TX23_22245 [Pseudomonas paralactis]
MSVAPEGLGVDEIQVPERMLQFFLKSLPRTWPDAKALAAAKGKRLIEVCPDLETTVVQQGLKRNVEALAAFVRREEQALAGV